MFAKILIANRGEIACRVMRTARRMGVATVAVYSEADAGALHAAMAGEARLIGPPPARQSYLNAQAIIAAAKDTGAEAIHPGYGFLSENAEFAEACAAAGIVFIGPPPTAMRAMGSKAAAKALMQQAGVPVVPGYHGDDQEPAHLQKEAEAIGFPVLIKASGGGGGRGMRIANDAVEFPRQLDGAKREAAASFGDDRVLIEKYLAWPRHIEVQVFADAHGNVVHLFERDCSIQRRYQKVVEEAPAPGLKPKMRAAMGEAAVAAAKAVGYVGAGTVEFIVEKDRFYFMEMNTRLQVEHPVTEAITGLDLVEWQLRVAAGEPLPLRQEQLSQHGHAIEARICAENPDAGFMPATGTLQLARWPRHVAFERSESLARVDSGIREGDAITPFYDSMIAKLIVWGATRAQALARLDAALRDTHLMGPATNVAFLRRVVGSRAFAGADLDTALIEREHAALFEAPGLAPEIAAAAVAAQVLAAEAAGQDADPWSRRDGWRLHGGARRRLSLRLQRPAQELAVVLERLHDGATRLDLGEQGWPFSARPLGPDRFDLRLGERRLTVAVHARGERYAVFCEAGSAELTRFDPIAHAGDAAEAGAGLAAPMPGKLVALLVAAGDAVQRGQALAVMEAMKMEHTIAAPRDGVVEALLYAVGDQVADGAALLRLSAPAA
ncbi:MAG: acetyl-CoA carboxylase biotin carboxylase subunit [Burkholderiales bacterium]|nr:acetyl-CoA carboxylase biotin carboxylase subunit [Burkholderiales bacterium]